MTETILILLTLVLRIPFLHQSLWLDEAIEALALQGKMGPLLTYALSDFQPPLYHGLLYLWTQLAGTSEVALRIPSLFAGLGVVIIGSKIAKALGTGKAELITGLLLATNPLLIYYSVEGRTYMLTTFFVVLSFYCLIVKKNTLLLLATVGIVWTSYLGWLVVGIQGLYLIIHKKWTTLIPLVIGGCSIIFWLPSFFQSLNIGRGTLTNSPAWASVVGALTWRSLPLTWVKFVIGRISFDNKLLYAAIVTALSLLHLSILRRFAQSSKLKAQSLLLLWLLGPITLGLVVASFLPVYQYFRVLFVLPAYLILLGLAVAAGQRDHMITRLLVTTQLIFLLIYAFSPRFHHEDWRGVVASYGTSATYALPSLNQDAPLLYYGVSRQKLIEPKSSLPPESPTQIVYIRYAEELFDGGGTGRANLVAAGYTKASELVYSGLAVEVYTK